MTGAPFIANTRIVWTESDWILPGIVALAVIAAALFLS